jgi:hypothetical protein
MSRQISGSFFGGSGSSGGRSGNSGGGGGSSGGGSGSSGGGSGSSGGGSGSGRWTSQLPWLRWGAGQPQRRANVLPFLALPAPALKAVFRKGGETIWKGGGGSFLASSTSTSRIHRSLLSPTFLVFPSSRSKKETMLKGCGRGSVTIWHGSGSSGSCNFVSDLQDGN